MPFQVITGRFHVAGYSPDGDSVRFEADNVSHLFDLGGRAPRVNARGHVQLRLEGIDALETHFNPASGGGSLNQPLEFAHAATDGLLDFLDISAVEWNQNRSVIVAADGPAEGYILSRSVDKFGRPIAFVFVGDPPQPNGASFRLEAPFLRKSFNHKALLDGLAYSTFYWGLFHDLREELTNAVSEARASQTGLYARDVTNSGFEVATIADLTDRHVIMPKLFRRLTDYFVSTGNVTGFKEALAMSEEPVLHIASAHFTHFDTFVEQSSGSNMIRLTEAPEGLVFDPMPERPANAFAEIVEVREEMELAELLEGE